MTGHVPGIVLPWRKGFVAGCQSINEGDDLVDVGAVRGSAFEHEREEVKYIIAVWIPVRNLVCPCKDFKPA
jgi:hypothetical protein